MRKWTISKRHAQKSIRQYLQEEHYFSKRLIAAILYKGGSVKVNGKQKRVTYRLKEGDELTISFPPEEQAKSIVPENLPLEIVYEDEDLMVINKPPNMATLPSLNQSTGTVANALIAYYQKHNLPYTVHIVTRLDRQTSGLLLIAKHRYAHAALSRLHQERKISRTYEAIIHHPMQEASGTIDLPIGRKKGSIIERTVTEKGKRAVTHFKRIQSFTNYTHVEIELETGRTHQIRVHFSHLGHPLVGDDLYGGQEIGIHRQALHCKLLKFTHPFTKDPLCFKAQKPKDFKELLKTLI